MGAVDAGAKVAVEAVGALARGKSLVSVPETLVAEALKILETPSVLASRGGVSSLSRQLSVALPDVTPATNVVHSAIDTKAASEIVSKSWQFERPIWARGEERLGMTSSLEQKTITPMRVGPNGELTRNTDLSTRIATEANNPRGLIGNEINRFATSTHPTGISLERPVFTGGGAATETLTWGHGAADLNIYARGSSGRFAGIVPEGMYPASVTRIARESMPGQAQRITFFNENGLFKTGSRYSQELANAKGMTVNETGDVLEIIPMFAK